MSNLKLNSIFSKYWPGKGSKTGIIIHDNNKHNCKVYLIKGSKFSLCVVSTYINMLILYNLTPYKQKILLYYEIVTV